MEKFKIFLQKPLYKKFLMWHLLIIIIIGGAVGGGSGSSVENSSSGDNNVAQDVSLTEINSLARTHFIGAGQSLVDSKEVAGFYLFLTSASNGMYCVTTTSTNIYGDDFKGAIINADCGRNKVEQFYAL